MSGAIADLYIEFRAITEPAIAGFNALASAGEGLAAKIDASLKSIDVATKGIGAGMAEAASQLSAASSEIVAANERAAESFKLVTDAARASATEVGAAEEGMGAKAATAANEIAAANERSSASFQAEAAAAARANAEMAASMEANRTATAAATTTAAAMTAQVERGTAKMSAGATASAAFGSSLSNTAGKVGLTSKQLLGLGAASTFVSVETVKMAATFDQQMELIATQAHAPQQEVDNLRQKVLELAPAVGIGPDKLAEALYHLESVGLRGDQAMAALAASAKGAQIGIADLDTVAYAMSGVMSAGMRDVQGYADGVAFLNTIVGQGDMKMQDLAKAIGTGVLPAFKDAGLGMRDFGAALATLTDNSVPAEVAANHLKTSVQLLQNQSGPAKKALAELGIGAGQLGKDLESGGLQQALVDIQTHMENFVPAGGKVKLSLQQVQAESQKFYQALIQDGATAEEAQKATERYTESLNRNGSAAVQAGALLSKAFGGARSASTMETLVQEADRFNTKLHEMGTAAQRAAQLQADWTRTQEQFKVKMNEAKAGIESLAMQIGNVLMPVLSAIVGAIGTATAWLAQHKIAAEILAGVIGGIVVGAFAALAIAVGSAIAAVSSAVLIITAVVAAVGAAAAVIIGNWGTIKQFFIDLWNGVKQAFSDAGTWIGQKVDAIGKFFSDLPGKIGSALSSLGSTIMSALSSVGEAMIAPFRSAWQAVERLFQQSPQKIAGDLGAFIGTLLGTIVRGMMDFGEAVNHGIDVAVNWFKQLPGKIKAAVSSAVTWLVQTATDMWHGFQNALASAYNATAAWLSALPGRIKAFFAAAGTWLVEHARALWNGFQNTVVSAWNATAAWFSALPGKIKAFFAAAGTWLVEAGKAILQGLLNGIESMVGTVLSSVKSFASNLVSSFTSALGIHSPSTVFQEHGVNIIQGLQDGLAAQQPAAIADLQRVPEQIVQVFANSPTLLTSAGQQLMNGLQQGISQAAPAVTSAVQQFATNLLQTVNTAFGSGGGGQSQQFLQIGTGLMTGLRTGITQTAPSVIQAVTTMCQNVINAGKSALNPQAFYQMGVNLMNSLASGIRAATPGAVAAAQSAANQVNAAAKGAFKQASPSKVWYEMGLNNVDGLTNAIVDRTEHAVTAARAMADQVNAVFAESNLRWDTGNAAATAAGSVGGASRVLVMAGDRAGGASGPGGGGDIHIHLTVQGNVWTTNDLVTEIQQNLLRHGARNSGPGINFGAGFGTGR